MSEPALELITTSAGRESGRRSPPHARNTALLRAARWFINSISFLLGDAAALLLSFSGASMVRDLVKGGNMLPDWTFGFIVFWSILSLGIHLTPGWGVNAIEEIRRTTLLLSAIFAGVTSMLFLTKEADATSRLTLGLAFLFALILLPTLRQLVKSALIRTNVWGMHVVIYGEEEASKDLITILQASPGTGYVPVGVYLTSPEQADTVEGIPVIDWDYDPYEFADTAMIIGAKTIEKQHPQFTEKKLHQYRRVLQIPEIEHNAPSLWITPRDLGGVLGMEISSNLQDFASRILKLAFDLVSVLLIAPIVLPILALIALLIWLQDFRSPLFLQERVGRHGKTFKMWKFRTMRPDAETLLKKKLEDDPAFREQWTGGFKVRKDPRITSLGRFLRRSSLDELPQILNVLRGEMSIIGPRPLPEYHDQKLPEQVRELRQRVRPGMTGLWQVSGRSESGNEGIARWDAYYVRNWSIWLDLVILLRTTKAVLCGNGAY